MPTTSPGSNPPNLPQPAPSARSGADAHARMRAEDPGEQAVQLTFGPEPASLPLARPARRASSGRVPPILVRQIRGGVEESVHRGSIVQANVDGAALTSLGNPDLLVNLRSCVKPFGLVALVEDGGIEAFDLLPAELAVMAASHSGEDQHVRTIQAVLRRAGLTQQLLGCGVEGAPLDEMTAARLARDGEKPGPIRHQCSGQHASMLLLCRMNDWPFEEYWRPDHPVQRLYAATVARAFGTSPALLVTSTDACGIPTYAFTLREVAQAYALLADPGAVPSGDPRASLAPALTTIRDAMMSNPEMVGGLRDRLDTAAMKAMPERLVSKGGSEGLRAFGLLSKDGRPAGGLALKVEDGAGYDRATNAASVEALRQIGALDSAGLQALSRYERPVGTDPRGEIVAEAVTDFDLPL